MIKLNFENIDANTFNRELMNKNFETGLIETNGNTITIEFPNETDQNNLLTRINSTIDINKYKLVKVPTEAERLASVESAINALMGV